MDFEENGNKYIVGQEVFDCMGDYYGIGKVLNYYKSDVGWEYEVCFPDFTEVMMESDLASPFYLTIRQIGSIG